MITLACAWGNKFSFNILCVQQSKILEISYISYLFITLKNSLTNTPH